MDEERSILPWVLFLSVLALVAFCAVWYFGMTPKVLPDQLDPPGQTPPAVRHPLVGKWYNGEFGTLIVYDDRWAAANGVKCHWDPAEGSAIRIELYLKDGWANLPPLTIMADFRLRAENGSRQAILNLMGQDLVFDRTEEGVPSEAAAGP